MTESSAATVNINLLQQREGAVFNSILELITICDNLLLFFF
jgi:hypothetical protein